MSGDPRVVAEGAGADVDRQVLRDINGPLNLAFEVEPENVVPQRDQNAVVEHLKIGSLAAFGNAYIVGIRHQSQTDGEKNILITD